MKLKKKNFKLQIFFHKELKNPTILRTLGKALPNSRLFFFKYNYDDGTVTIPTVANKISNF
jgi:hypothetical protein